MENIDIKYFDIEELGVWPLYSTDIEVSEGEIKLLTHFRRERNTKIVRLAKNRFKEVNGKLYCEICKFDFSKIYGDIGEGYIEAHHKKPIANMQPGDVTKIEDFLMVCSNCHSMLHSRNEEIDIEELKIRVRRTKNDK